jgi:ATP-dependent DNA helicase RecG
MTRPGQSPDSRFRGVAEEAAKIGLLREADLLVHLPLRYEDETRITPVECLWRRAGAGRGGRAQQRNAVPAAPADGRPGGDGSGEITLRFFSFYPSQQAALSEGSRIRAFGEVRGGFFGAEMVHPRFRKVGDDEPLPRNDADLPVDRRTGQFGPAKADRQGAGDGDLSDTLPDDCASAETARPGAQPALPAHPAAGTDLDTLHARNHPAWRRVKFDEVLAQQLSLRRAYLARREQGAPVLVARDDLGARLLDSLPFGLTGAQRGRWPRLPPIWRSPPDAAPAAGRCRCRQDHRRRAGGLPGDFGRLAGGFMAPTEILAEQHYLKLGLAGAAGRQVAWLSGSLKKAKREQLAATASEAQLVVGTHALIQEGVDFARLGLAIVDEQHRFGVAQRLALRKKGDNPHQLMMSATPIPRTLAMSYYADLDVTVLDELPPGRTPIKTRLVADNRRDDVVGFVKKHVEEGRQAYWVCPLIEESEACSCRRRRKPTSSCRRLAGTDGRAGAWPAEGR